MCNLDAPSSKRLVTVSGSACRAWPTAAALRIPLHDSFPVFVDGPEPMLALSTSTRETVPETTFTTASPFARELGIVRVTDVTRLDRVGVPVFASIRPSAARNSLCVNAGKGLLPAEARTSALMEAIEFAVVESPRVTLESIHATPRFMLGPSAPAKLLRLCPRYGQPIPLDYPMSWIMFDSMHGHSTLAVPDELALFPLPTPSDTLRFFGASTNGLASGNTPDEAAVHAILELIERDIESFRLAHDLSTVVDSSTLPGTIRELSDALRGEGLLLVCRHVPNVFGIPYFAAFILEQDTTARLFASEGFGCHPSPQIALTRAVTEAAQSRLSHIHGGRDDIVERYNLFKDCGPRAEVEFNRYLEESITRGARSTFNGVEPLAVDNHSQSATLKSLLALLTANGFEEVGRVILTRPEDPVAVVRVVIPGLEALNSTTKRVGVRLAEYVRSHVA